MRMAAVTSASATTRWFARFFRTIVTEFLGFSSVREVAISIIREVNDLAFPLQLYFVGQYIFFIQFLRHTIDTVLGVFAVYELVCALWQLIHFDLGLCLGVSTKTQEQNEG